MTSLAQLYAMQPHGADWLQVLADNDSVLHALDAFLSRACAAQSKRLDVLVLPSEELQTLQDDARVVFALYARLLAALEDSAQPPAADVMTAMRATLLHVARLLPFCQLFAQRSPLRVRALLDATATHVEEFKTELKQLARVYTTHFDHVHLATGHNKRNQIVDLIQSTYEVSLSIYALSLSSAALEILFGASEDATLAAGSLVRALAVCYEADVPVLQRSLTKLDETAQKKAALLIPESRRVLLTVLDRVFQAAMKREKGASGTGEGVLMMIHELSHSTDADTADHGSFISDLWHLCGYEAKLLEFFDEIKLDRDSVSYLEVILDGLPRRRVLNDDDHKMAAPQKDQPASVAEHSEAPQTPPDVAYSSAGAVSNELSSLVSQVQDLFPDLGDGYVALCLVSSQNQLETVINYLLEGNPPPVVSSVRTDLKCSDAEYAALERKALGKESLTSVAAAPPVKSEKVDPSRIWKGKRAMEKHYDPQVARKDPSIVEKVMQIVDEYAEEDNFREVARQQSASGNAIADDNTGGGFVLDEYDDDYNDEFEDYEPFSVHDGGQADDFDAIRLQNRRLRELEAEDAFWEGMRNQNRRAVDVAVADDEDDDEEGDEAESKHQGSSQWARGPSRGEWKPQPGKDATASGGAHASRARGGGPQRRGADGAPGAPMTEQQQQRQRQRDNKNKAKVGNHHRKDRALKKRG